MTSLVQSMVPHVVAFAEQFLTNVPGARTDLTFIDFDRNARQTNPCLRCGSSLNSLALVFPLF